MRGKIGLPILLMALFALTRWPGFLPPNFSAAYALAFCAGVYFSGAMAWWLPLVTLFVSDVILNVFSYGIEPVNDYMLVNYGAYAALIGLGRLFTSKTSWLTLVGGGLLGAIIFYFLTNTAAWLQNPEYSKTLGGWIQALTVGTTGWPHTWEFFRNTLLSGGLFAGLFAAAMKSEAPEPAPEPDEEPEAEGGVSVVPTPPEEAKA